MIPTSSVITAFLLRRCATMPTIDGIRLIMEHAQHVNTLHAPDYDVVEWLQSRLHFKIAVVYMTMVDAMVQLERRVNPQDYPQIPWPVRHWLDNVAKGAIIHIKGEAA